MKRFAALLATALLASACNLIEATVPPDRLPRFEARPAHPRIALVLGSGGPRGFAHIGVLKALEEAGIKPFMGWQVPTAVIALKQGAGRLIRDVNDRGVLVLCDPRLSTKGYGRLFLASLPPMPRTRELADVQAFFDTAEARSS